MMSAPLTLDVLLLAALGGAVLTAIAAVVAARARRTSAEFRHSLLMAATVTHLALPAALLALHPGPTGCVLVDCGPQGAAARNSARTQEFYTAGAAGKFTDLGSAPAQGPSPVWPQLAGALLAVWGAGFVFMLIGIARRRLRAGALAREARPILAPGFAAQVRALATRAGLPAGIRVTEHPAVRIPAVAGVFRPTLLVPPGFAEDSAETIGMVMEHELAHVRRRDGLASLLAELAVALFWFDPATRYAARKLRDLQELAADSAVLGSGIRPSRYAGYLLEAFRRVTASPAPGPCPGHAIIGDCQLESRIRSILDPRAPRPTPPILSLGAPAALVLLGAGLAASPSLLSAYALTRRAQVPAIDRRMLAPAALDSVLRPVFINTMADRYVAGAAIAVVHEGRIVYRQGFGRREVFHEVPVDPERTIWRIGSITKVLTGVAVMQLTDRGLIDLDADVNSYLKDFKLPATFPEPVRVRHLLTHTAGFDQLGVNRHARRASDVLPLGEFLKSNLIRIRPPGEYTTYDTYGVTLAGYLVEQLSGMPYEEYLKRYLLSPLGMNRSGIAVPPALAGDVAVGYGFAGSWEAEPWEYMNTNPASTVNGTVMDMAAFAIMLLEGGKVGQTRVLSEGSARAMLTPQFTNHPDQPGYGYTLFEDRSFGVPAMSHGGSMSGYGAFLFLVPEARLGVFIATNQESGTVANAAIKALVDAVFPDHPPAVTLRPHLAAPSDLTRFTGRYANSMHNHTHPDAGWRRRPFEVTVDSLGRMVFGGQPAFPVGPLSFQRDDGVLLTFHENARGDVVRFEVNQTVYERLP